MDELEEMLEQLMEEVKPFLTKVPRRKKSDDTGTDVLDYSKCPFDLEDSYDSQR